MRPKNQKLATTADHAADDVVSCNDTEIAVLSALFRRPLYGLLLVDEVARVRLTLGSIYPVLHRMQDKGLIEGYWGDESETRLGARRRYYRVTGLGEQVLQDTRRMVTMAFRRRPAHA